MMLWATENSVIQRTFYTGVRKMNKPSLQSLQKAYAQYLRQYITREVGYQNLPGGVCGKLYSTTIGDFAITHIHHNGNSGYQSGTLTFTYEGSPYWVFNYNGMYPKEVVPFVIEALGDGLLTGEPLLRGPNVSTPDFTYINTVTRDASGDDFVAFSGEEMVLGIDGTKTPDVLGRFKYFGGVIPPQCQIIE
jgi:hypothetical protein